MQGRRSTRCHKKLIVLILRKIVQCNTAVIDPRGELGKKDSSY